MYNKINRYLSTTQLSKQNIFSCFLTQRNLVLSGAHKKLYQDLISKKKKISTNKRSFLSGFYPSAASYSWLTRKLWEVDNSMSPSAPISKWPSSEKE